MGNVLWLQNNTYSPILSCLTAQRSSSTKIATTGGLILSPFPGESPGICNGATRVSARYFAGGAPYRVAQPDVGAQDLTVKANPSSSNWLDPLLHSPILFHPLSLLPERDAFILPALRNPQSFWSWRSREDSSTLSEELTQKKLLWSVAFSLTGCEWLNPSLSLFHHTPWMWSSIPLPNSFSKPSGRIDDLDDLLNVALLNMATQVRLHLESVATQGPRNQPLKPALPKVPQPEMPPSPHCKQSLHLLEITAN